LEIARSSTNVWPGYVAAVSSLLLSLLLLAGVLAVAISQAGRVVEAYNNKLIASVILDEQRGQELEKLRTATSGREIVATQPIASSPPPQPSPIDREQATWRILERTLQMKAAEYEKIRDELQGLMPDRRTSVANPKEPESLKLYRLVFAAGAEGLDASMLAQLRQHHQRDSSSNSHYSWSLESDSKGLDTVAEREIYRLMLAVRSQLQALGISSNQVKVTINRERTPQDFQALKPGQQRGEITMTLRRETQKSGS
jgi:hypothetical protein